MIVPNPWFLWNLFCVLTKCEVGFQPPYISFRSDRSERTLNLELEDPNLPLVKTKLGQVLGYKMTVGDESSPREIFAFTGVPYGEQPLSFQDPVPRKPWKGIWDATSPSPYCIQTNPFTLGSPTGQEDCLFLDIYTPKLMNPAESELLPVIIWQPVGASVFGRSQVLEPSEFLRKENVIHIAINCRMGIFGWASTGDDSCRGNFAFRDQLLALEWVHSNIQAFGGDQRRIVVGGVSSGGIQGLLMLVAKHKARNYLSGVISMSGSPYTHGALDSTGRVKEATKVLARRVGCPQDNSEKLVTCLAKLNPYYLVTQQRSILGYTIGPVVEHNSSKAIITELPEVSYEKEDVARVPIIISRTEKEMGALGNPVRLAAPILAQPSAWLSFLTYYRSLGYRSSKPMGANVTSEQRRESVRRVTQFYYGKETPPNFLTYEDYSHFVDMQSDLVFTAGIWKQIKLHQKIAPTYAYINKHNAYNVTPAFAQAMKILNISNYAAHGSEWFLLYKYPLVRKPFPAGSDLGKAARNLVNLLVNFATYGKPYYRTESGELLDVWKPIEDMRNPLVLEVGLVNSIKMIQDPAQASGRLNLWEEVLI